MTLGQAIATIFGGFLFPFMIRMMWNALIKEFGTIGGFLCAAFIIGPAWLINHGMATPLITQSGGIWIDMALAGGIGVLVATIAKGDKIKGSEMNLLAALVGGVLAGLLLSLFM